MKIIDDIEQGSDEWKKLRAQYFTASAMGDWLIEQPQLNLTIAEMTAFLKEVGTEIPKGAKWADLAALLPDDVRQANLSYTVRRNDSWQNAIEARLGNISDEEEPEWDTWATKRGKELEPAAREAYEARHGGYIATVGFVAHESDDFGCSPDGLVCGVPCKFGKRVDVSPGFFLRGLELKCHVPRTHIRFWRRGGFREEHAMQCHVSMAVTGIREWHLFGYCPEAPSLFEVFKWDETTDRVLAALLALSEDYWTAYQEFGDGVRKELTLAPTPAQR